MPSSPPRHQPPGYREQRKRIELDHRVDTQFYRQSPWRKLRAQVLAEQPLCVHCLIEDRITEASCVDHVIPIKQAPDRKLDRANLQGLCHMHHSMKTAKENDFGNKQ